MNRRWVCSMARKRSRTRKYAVSWMPTAYETVSHAPSGRSCAWASCPDPAKRHAAVSKMAAALRAGHRSSCGRLLGGRWHSATPRCPSGFHRPVGGSIPERWRSRQAAPVTWPPAGHSPHPRPIGRSTQCLPITCVRLTPVRISCGRDHPPGVTGSHRSWVSICAQINDFPM
jgi:hypothetical protein